MASFQQPFYTQSPVRRTPSTSSSTVSSSRSPSISSPSMSSVSSPYSSLSPRVQLIPHTTSLGFDSIFSPSERMALDNTSFDDLDLSSQDFDFDDIFTYDRPQQKLTRAVEVSSPNRLMQGERDWSGFNFSHYSNGTNTSGVVVGAVTNSRERSRPSRTRSRIGEMYLRNGREARKR